MRRSDRSPPPPLDAAALERAALRYVERYATTRAKLRRYLADKLRARGFAGDGEPPVDALVERIAALGYVDDAAFATARSEALARRGFGARRVADALRHAGVAEEDTPEAPGEGAALAAALVYARRRLTGPYAAAPADRQAQEKQIAAMVRAGHPPALARRIARMAPGEEPDQEQD